ncbi:MAG: YceI family protein [Lacibacter sp.]
MKNYLFLSFLLVTSFARAQSFIPVEKGSAVKFEINNFGFNVDGTFKEIFGSIQFDEGNLSGSSFNVTVNSNTVNTNNSTRDKHLRGEDYFNVTAFPVIRIVSTRIAKSTTPGYFVFFGKLTIKGISQDIVFPFKAVEEGGAYSFTGELKIKRRDFNIGGTNSISNDLKVVLNVLTEKK